MRIQMFGSSLLAVAALVGCGGDDGGIVVHDAKVFKDAAIDAPHICGVDASLGTLTFGSMTAPVMRQNFDVVMQGADNGKLEFFIAARLGMNTTPPIDALIIDVIKPATNFATGTPYNFETDATTQGSIVGDAYVLGDLDQTAMTIGNWLWAQSGSLSFTLFEGTANTKKINGTVTMVPFKEIDQETGDLMPGGCSSMIGGLTFYLQQNADAPMATARTIDGTLQSDQADPALEMAIQKVKDLKAARIAKAAELFNQ